MHRRCGTDRCILSITGKTPTLARAHMDGMVFRGYVPQDGVTGGWGEGEFNFSWSMEGSGTDFAIASMAKYLRDKAELGSEAWQKYNDEYLYFTARATNYVHLFNESRAVGPCQEVRWDVAQDGRAVRSYGTGLRLL